MKKIMLAALLAASPLLTSAANVNIDIGNVRVQAPGVTVTFGSRNDRGYYWDGYEYRDPDYWRKHDGHRGERYYTGHGRKEGHRDEDREDRHHCPPGQAKKGNC